MVIARVQPTLWRTATTVAVAVLLAFAQTAHAERMVLGIILPSRDVGTDLDQAVAKAAEQGAVMAAEEFSFNAEMFGLEFELLIERADSSESAVEAARRLVVDHEAFAVVGGYGDGVAHTLTRWSAEQGVPFLNIGSSSDALRHEACASTAFHVEPSAAMYIDSLAGWYVRSGFRRWYVVHVDDAEGDAQYERAVWSLNERHFGARIVGRLMVPAGGGDAETVASAVRRADADLLVLFVSAEDQLRWLEELEAMRVDVEVAAYPHPDAQTRAFFAASRETAPTLGTGFRALAFEATLDAYGARELNARFRQRWDAPMDPPAWAAHQAIKMLFEAATFGGSTDAGDVRAYLSASPTVFDLYKGIGTSFRPWDHQLRQTIYLVGIAETASDAFDLGLLVGELPAIYLPGTDPLERLDQIGDLAARSRCEM